MAQAVSCRPPTAEAQVRARVSPCGICGGKSGIGTACYNALVSKKVCVFVLLIILISTDELL
jgi:hypothetical protein